MKVPDSAPRHAAAAKRKKVKELRQIQKLEKKGKGRHGGSKEKDERERVEGERESAAMTERNTTGRLEVWQ